MTHTQADLDAAVSQTREECARIAENRWREWTETSGVECDVTACVNIAAAIRKGDKP